MVRRVNQPFWGHDRPPDPTRLCLKRAHWNRTFYLCGINTFMHNCVQERGRAGSVRAGSTAVRKAQQHLKTKTHLKPTNQINI